MKKHLLPIVLSILCATTACAQKTMSDNAYQRTELLKNSSFEDEAKPIRNRRFGPNGEGELFGGYLPAGIIPGWFVSTGEGSQIVVTTDNLSDPTQRNALCWTISEATSTSPAAIVNVGIHGIDAIKGSKYTLTFWAHADKKYKGKLRVGLQSKDDGTWYAQSTIKGKIKKKWKRYTLTFTAEGDEPNARFVIEADMPGTLYLDEVSLYCCPAAIKR